VLRRTVDAREKEIAAVIMEPIMCNTGCIPPREGFLEGVRELCSAKAIPLIFDEIITGFRCALGGAQALYGVTPDIAAFGKAMAAGFPMSAIAGKTEFMRLIADREVMHAGTFNTYNPGVAASLATIRRMTAKRNEMHRKLTSLGKRLMAGIRSAAARQGKSVLVQGPGPMFHVGFTERSAVYDYRESQDYDTARYGRLVQAMQERGVRLIGRGIWYVSAAHTQDDVDDTLGRFEDALREV
jgi:glutamate-1-semialdehyde 2,1-aminomutase